MFAKSVLPAVFALSMLAGLAPAYALTSAAPEVSTSGATIHSKSTVSGLDPAALAQIAGDAGVSMDQARGMTLSQLYFLKESRDSDTPDVWKGQQPLPWPPTL